MINYSKNVQTSNVNYIFCFKHLQKQLKSIKTHPKSTFLPPQDPLIPGQRLTIPGFHLALGLDGLTTLLSKKLLTSWCLILQQNSEQSTSCCLVLKQNSEQSTRCCLVLNQSNEQSIRCCLVLKQHNEQVWVVCSASTLLSKKLLTMQALPQIETEQ